MARRQKRMLTKELFVFPCTVCGKRKCVFDPFFSDLKTYGYWHGATYATITYAEWEAEHGDAGLSPERLSKMIHDRMEGSTGCAVALEAR